MSLLCLHCFSTSFCIEHFSCGCPLSCEDNLAGCASNCFAFPCGFGYFLHLFRTKIEHYLLKLTRRKKPKLIIVCMLYYLDELCSGTSWADRTLSALSYNSKPSKVQTLLRQLFYQAISKIKIPGCRVIPIPLFESLDGKTTEDYVQRVEPSAIGGRKMAKQLVDVIDQAASEGFAETC